MGKYVKVEAMHRRAVEGYEGAWSRAPRNIQKSQKPWGSAEEAGQLRRGRSDASPSAVISETVLGEVHPSTVNSMKNLGLVLQSQFCC